MTPVVTQKNGVVAERLQLGNKKKQNRLKTSFTRILSLVPHVGQKITKRV
jgi:hypothetical protein